jgi:hypothetical protein
MDDQLRNSSNPKARKEAGIPSALHMAGRFAKLEEADIPREWTGKVLMAIKQRERSNIYGRPADRIGTSPYTGISRIMRPMTNEQRETFVSLYPEWEGTLEELANAARLL